MFIIRIYVYSEIFAFSSLFVPLFGNPKNAQNAKHRSQEVTKGSDGALWERFYVFIDLLRAFGHLLDISLVVLGRQKCAGPRFWTLR